MGTPSELVLGLVEVLAAFPAARVGAEGDVCLRAGGGGWPPADGGGGKVEIRMMFLRRGDEPKPILLQNRIRLSRGKMLGVDFNKNMAWVGSTLGLAPLAQE